MKFWTCFLNFWKNFWVYLDDIPDLRDPREAKYYIFQIICTQGMDNSSSNRALAQTLMNLGHLPASKLPKEVLDNPHIGNNLLRIDLGHTIDALLILSSPPR